MINIVPPRQINMESKTRSRCIYKNFEEEEEE